MGNDKLSESQVLKDLLENGEYSGQVQKDESTEEKRNDKDSFFKNRIMKTVILLITIILQGIAHSVVGPSFVDLEQYFNCDTAMMSWLSPAMSLGVVVASIITLVGLNRLSTEFSFGISMACVAVATILRVSVPSIYWFLFMGVIMGFCSCIGICECQPYCLKLWENHRFQKMVIHLIHALASVGFTIGPFIATPFLADHNPLSNHEQNGEEESYASDRNGNSSMTESSFNTSNAMDVLGNTTEILYLNSAESNSIATILMEYTGKVQYAFITVGIPLLLPSCLFVIVCAKSGVPLKRPARPTKSKHCNEGSDPAKLAELNVLSRMDRNLLLALSFAFYSFNAVLEFIPSNYLTYYVTTALDWKTPQRTLINSAFHGSLCIGRILGVPLSRCIKQRTMLAFNICVILMGSGLLLASYYHSSVMWISACMLGIGLSTSYGANLLWLSESIPVNTRIMGAVIISHSVGGTLGPLIVGQLFEVTDPICMTYFLFGAAIIEFVLYVFLRILECRRTRKTSKKIQQPTSHRKI